MNRTKDRSIIESTGYCRELALEIDAGQPKTMTDLNYILRLFIFIFS